VEYLEISNSKHQIINKFKLLKIKIQNYVVHLLVRHSDDRRKEESPNKDDYIPFCSKGGLLLRRPLSRASFGVTVDCEGEAITPPVISTTASSLTLRHYPRHSDDRYFLRHSDDRREEACPAGRRESSAVNDRTLFCL